MVWNAIKLNCNQFQQQILPHFFIETFMNIFLNPCRCECDKQITKSELIVIMKTNYLPNKEAKPIFASQTKPGTIAMQPKHIDVSRRQSIFKSKIPRQVYFKDLEHFINDPILQSLHQQAQYRNFERTTSNDTTLMKAKSTENYINSKNDQSSKNQKILKERVMNVQLEGQTQRKTMKKHKNPPRQIKDQAKDLLLTTKRCKKQYNGISPPPESNKENLSMIEQEPKQKFMKDKGKQNEPKPNKQNHETMKTQNPSEKSVKLMIDQIGMLKKQLKRLEDDEKRLLKEKDQNERFFEEDFAINEKKKENLKKSCKDRYNQINDLKKLLQECKSRAI